MGVRHFSEYQFFEVLTDIFAFMLDLSLVEYAFLDKASMLEQDKLARLIFSRWKLKLLHLSELELVPIG
jgi:hypothetical protein